MTTFGVINTRELEQVLARITDTHGDDLRMCCMVDKIGFSKWNEDGSYYERVAEINFIRE